jgi:ubiquinone/menaquinone biosynthesis C-methylase UbiE
MNISKMLTEKQITFHQQHYKEILERGETGYDGFINIESIWYWMHVYCLEDIKIFFENIKKSTFLTIGDGYCGREAGYIKRSGHKVHASDIETSLIQIAHEKGIIDEYSYQDIHDLTFDDNSFDYVLTKESLHHLSMPYHGLYEMLRVARNGVILIEPNGEFDQQNNYFADYEISGNYIFRFNTHELIKIGLSYGYNNFVWTYSNMFYGTHNMENINNGKITEEKDRLTQIDKNIKLENKPLLIFFFLKNEKDYNIFTNNNKFKRFYKKK